MPIEKKAYAIIGRSIIHRLISINKDIINYNSHPNDIIVNKIISTLNGIRMTLKSVYDNYVSPFGTGAKKSIRNTHTYKCESDNGRVILEDPLCLLELFYM